MAAKAVELPLSHWEWWKCPNCGNGNTLKRDACVCGQPRPLNSSGVTITAPEEPKRTGSRKPRQTKTEQAYGRILEARKQHAEIVEYIFEGMSLAWGANPETKKPMWYTADFVVWPTGGTLELHEVKGGHIFEKDRIRFKGCRAEWGMHFRFVMCQKKGQSWTQIE